ncbi:MAG TPA: acetyl-CoA hydrolase/transferase C-terminal domain-containing protein [Candidatus Sulfotelmatobacter sp.]|nr:acetyl-CoA hydrolase/transferase C-terminal domain-containing protein [Candidatus Sulfotelmatobacter sp.]
MGYRTSIEEYAPFALLNGTGYRSPTKEYAAKLTTPAKAVQSIQSGSTLCLALAVGMPGGLAKAVADRILSGDLKNLNLYYQHSMRYSEETLICPEVLSKVDARCFFMGDPDRKMVQLGLSEGRKYLSYVPINFSNIPRALTEYIHPDTFLVTVSPMDKSGHFSLGTNNDYASTAVRHCPRVIVEVNRHMPRVFGDSLVHISEVHAIVENDAPLVQIPYKEPDADSMKIGKCIAEQIPDGATLQLGIGNLPNAVAMHLGDRNDLGIHSELFSHAFVRLIKSGVVTGRKKTLHPRKHVFTFAIGDDEVYDFIDDNPSMESYPSSYVNDIHVIKQHDNMMSVNTAIEIDLYGQVNAEFIHGHQYSGSGGQFDFVKGASFSKGGKSFIGLKAAAKDGTISCIVPHVQMSTDTRMDVEYIATEYGCVNLRGKSTRERALALISIAHPNFRDQLMAHAKSINLI